MTFEEFKIALAAEVANMVGEEVNVTLHKVQKNNGVIMEAISVMEVGKHVSPTIYLDDLYTETPPSFPQTAINTVIDTSPTEEPPAPSLTWIYILVGTVIFITGTSIIILKRKKADAAL